MDASTIDLSRLRNLRLKTPHSRPRPPSPDRATDNTTTTSTDGGDGPSDFTLNLEKWMRGAPRDAEANQSASAPAPPPPRPTVEDYNDDSAFVPLGTSTPAPAARRCEVVDEPKIPIDLAAELQQTREQLHATLKVLSAMTESNTLRNASGAAAGAARDVGLQTDRPAGMDWEEGELVVRDGEQYVFVRMETFRKLVECYLKTAEMTTMQYTTVGVTEGSDDRSINAAVEILRARAEKKAGEDGAVEDVDGVTDMVPVQQPTKDGDVERDASQREKDLTNKFQIPPPAEEEDGTKAKLQREGEITDKVPVQQPEETDAATKEQTEKHRYGAKSVPDGEMNSTLWLSNEQVEILRRIDELVRRGKDPTPQSSHPPKTAGTQAVGGQASGNPRIKAILRSEARKATQAEPKEMASNRLPSKQDVPRTEAKEEEKRKITHTREITRRDGDEEKDKIDQQTQRQVSSRRSSNIFQTLKDLEIGNVTAMAEIADNATFLAEFFKWEAKRKQKKHAARRNETQNMVQSHDQTTRSQPMDSTIGLGADDQTPVRDRTDLTVQSDKYDETRAHHRRQLEPRLRSEEAPRPKYFERRVRTAADDEVQVTESVQAVDDDMEQFTQNTALQPADHSQITRSMDFASFMDGDTQLQAALEKLRKQKENGKERSQRHVSRSERAVPAVQNDMDFTAESFKPTESRPQPEPQTQPGQGREVSLRSKNSRKLADFVAYDPPPPAAETHRRTVKLSRKIFTAEKIPSRQHASGSSAEVRNRVELLLAEARAMESTTEDSDAVFARFEEQRRTEVDTRRGRSALHDLVQAKCNEQRRRTEGTVTKEIVTEEEQTGQQTYASIDVTHSVSMMVEVKASAPTAKNVHLREVCDKRTEMSKITDKELLAYNADLDAGYVRWQERQKVKGNPYLGSRHMDTDGTFNLDLLDFRAAVQREIRRRVKGLN